MLGASCILGLGLILSDSPAFPMLCRPARGTLRHLPRFFPWENSRIIGGNRVGLEFYPGFRNLGTRLKGRNQKY